MTGAPLILMLAVVSGCETTSPAVYQTVSPTGNVVRLIGDLHATPSWPFNENTVSIDVPRTATRALPRYYAADFLDDSFRQAFPSDQWLSGNVLRFNWAEGKSFRRWPLIIRNNSERQVPLLLIGAGDEFVILKFDRGAQLALDVPENAGIYISGLLPDCALLERQTFSPSQVSGRALVVRHSRVEVADVADPR